MAQAQVQLKRSDSLQPISYRGDNATSTGATPSPAKMAEVYYIQQHQDQQIDWTAAALTWGEETRAWVEEVQEAGDEALRGSV